MTMTVHRRGARRRPTRTLTALVALVAGLLLAGCGSAASGGPSDATGGPAGAAPGGAEVAGATAPPRVAEHEAGRITVAVDTDDVLGTVSPLIRGVSGDLDAAAMTDAGITLNSWGGNPATRYNFALGNAWNAGADWSYRNGDYGQRGDVASRFVTETHEAGATVRLAVPTLGWVAADTDPATCSFPDGEGGCGDAGGATCTEPGPVADPTAANVRTTPDDVRAWVTRLTADAGPMRFIAMDNEPELWGVTHYDVHPTCTTYEEVLDTYLRYASAVREAAPGSELMGPVMCCWHEFWGTAPGPQDGSGEDFLPWFLERVRTHDEQAGVRTLDVVDVHYYPQSDVYHDRADAETAARRLRSTRSLYDPSYVDESWIGRSIALIPRLRETIAAAYPGTPLAISEWNFGADGTMNGALAIADVLGIYGREGVYAAAYWRSPAPDSPGYHAFKLHGNYDDHGGSFDGDAVRATTPDPDRLSAFATVDPGDGTVKVMLINKQPDAPLQVHLTGVPATPDAAVYRYSEAAPQAITSAPLAVPASGVDVDVPAYSIALLVLPPTGEPSP